MKKRFGYLAFIMLLALEVSLAGCSSSKSGGSAASTKDEALDIALIVKSVDSEYWLATKAGAEKAAKDLGVNLSFKGAPTEADIAGQVNIVENTINQNVEGIVLAASDAKALVEPAEKAIDKGIAVVTIDSGIESDKPQSFIATDNEKAAEEAASALAGMTGKKGDVGVVSFVPGVTTAILRESGFQKGIKQFPDMKIVTTQYSQSDQAKALSVTEDILTANPDIVGIFAANNKSALGAGQAIKQKGLQDQVSLVAFDADPELISQLKEGVIKALVVQNPYKMGYAGVENAVKAIKGEEVEKQIDSGVTVVTMENFKDPEVQELLYPGK